jgi:DNA-binding SARP family transcriptional activator
MSSGSSQLGEMLTISVLGPLEARRDDVSLALGGAKQRSVLGILALAPNQAVSRDRLIDALWEENEPGDALAALQVYVANLRRILDPQRDQGREGQLIESVKSGYRLQIEDGSLDLLQFNALVREASAVIGAERRLRLREAVRLWRGQLLQDLQGQRFLVAESARWDEALRSVYRDLFRAELAMGNSEGVLADLERLTAESPYDEALAGLRMIALFRSGRQAEALAAFGHVRERLVEDLGVEPSVELQELEFRILRQDRGLLDNRRSEAVAMATVRVSKDGSVPVAELDLAGRIYLLDRAVTTLGRLSDRDIVLDDQLASRRHAEIRRTTEGFELIDLGSTNGIAVNGRAITTHRLEDGDRISIGDLVLAFRFVS